MTSVESNQQQPVPQNILNKPSSSSDQWNRFLLQLLTSSGLPATALVRLSFTNPENQRCEIHTSHDLKKIAKKYGTSLENDKISIKINIEVLGLTFTKYKERYDKELKLYLKEKISTRKKQIEVIRSQGFDVRPLSIQSYTQDLRSKFVIEPIEITSAIVARNSNFLYPKIAIPIGVSLDIIENVDNVQNSEELEEIIEDELNVQNEQNIIISEQQSPANYEQNENLENDVEQKEVEELKEDTADTDSSAVIVDHSPSNIANINNTNANPVIAAFGALRKQFESAKNVSDSNAKTALNLIANFAAQKQKKEAEIDGQTEKVLNVKILKKKSMLMATVTTDEPFISFEEFRYRYYINNIWSDLQSPICGICQQSCTKSDIFLFVDCDHCFMRSCALDSFKKQLKLNQLPYCPLCFANNGKRTLVGENNLQVLFDEIHMGFYLILKEKLFAIQREEQKFDTKEIQSFVDNESSERITILQSVTGSTDAETIDDVRNNAGIALSAIEDDSKSNDVPDEVLSDVPVVSTVPAYSQHFENAVEILEIKKQKKHKRKKSRKSSFVEESDSSSSDSSSSESSSVLSSEFNDEKLKKERKNSSFLRKSKKQQKRIRRNEKRRRRRHREKVRRRQRRNDVEKLNECLHQFTGLVTSFSQSAMVMQQSVAAMSQMNMNSIYQSTVNDGNQRMVNFVGGQSLITSVYGPPVVPNFIGGANVAVPAADNSQSNSKLQRLINRVTIETNETPNNHQIDGSPQTNVDISSSSPIIHQQNISQIHQLQYLQQLQQQPQYFRRPSGGLLQHTPEQQSQLPPLQQPLNNEMIRKMQQPQMNIAQQAQQAQVQMQMQQRTPQSWVNAKYAPPMINKSLNTKVSPILHSIGMRDLVIVNKPSSNVLDFQNNSSLVEVEVDMDNNNNMMEGSSSGVQLQMQQQFKNNGTESMGSNVSVNNGSGMKDVSGASMFSSPTQASKSHILEHKKALLNVSPDMNAKLEQLENMGYPNRVLNLALLRQENGNVKLVLQSLKQFYPNIFMPLKNNDL